MKINSLKKNVSEWREVYSNSALEIGQFFHSFYGPIDNILFIIWNQVLEEKSSPQIGFEPTTHRLTADRSTTELLRNNEGMIIQTTSTFLSIFYIYYKQNRWW